MLEGYRLRLHKGGRVEEFDVEPDCPEWGEKPWHLIQESVAAFQAHAVAVLEGRAAAAPSGADNLATLRLTLGAIASARAGHTVGVA